MKHCRLKYGDRLLVEVESCLLDCLTKPLGGILLGLPLVVLHKQELEALARQLYLVGEFFAHPDRSFHVFLLGIEALCLNGFKVGNLVLELLILCYELIFLLLHLCDALKGVID